MSSHNDAQYVGLPTRNPDGGPESPQINLNDSPHLPSSPGLYTPPLGRDQHLQPSPSFLTVGNRDSSYANSLNSEAATAPGTRASWGSNALLNPGNRHDSYAGSSSPLARNESDEEIQNSPDPGFAPPISPRSPARSKRTSATANLGLGLGAVGAAGAAGTAWRNPSSEDELEEKSRYGQGDTDSEDKPRWAQGDGAKPRRRWLLWTILGAIALAAIALGVGLGVHFGTKNKDSSSATTGGVAGAADNQTSETPTASSSAKGSKPSSPTSTGVPLFTGVRTGTDGSQVPFSNGTTVTYRNRHGGQWAYDPSNPLLNDAQANSWTPPLSQPWKWEDRMFGVNLGGWFVTEPFIVPALYEKYTNGSGGQSVDEFTLSQNMGDQLATIMEEHYNTFITEEDFMLMADAGLNWIRLPIGYWALETFANEPFLEGVSWKYIVKALGWARKYGLRVKLDLHATPGSANGWNHSGRIGSLNFLRGVMGLANAQRTLDYIKRLAEFINQPEWRDVVPIFGIINEPRADPIGQNQLGGFYIEAHDMIRNITGYGEGKGAYISIFEGFIGVDKWYQFGQSASSGFDRVNMDIHQYTCFQDQDPRSIEVLADRPCQWWASGTNTTRNAVGVTLMGEASVAWNDCGHWLNEVGKGSRYDGTYPGYEDKKIGDCTVWNDDSQWNASVIAAYTDMMSGTQDSLFSWFFWTWKIGASTIYNHPVNTPWHYKRLLELGIANHDPRQAVGHCLNVASVTPVAFNGYKPYQTGGAGAGTVPAADRTQYPWPVTSLSPSFDSAALVSLPQYTQTGTPVLLVNAPTNTAFALVASASSAIPTATIGAAQAAFAPVAGCSYPNEYSAELMAMPTSACGAGQTGIIRQNAIAQPTPAPTAAAR
ncbi:hypothetical protein QFC22_001755 [Naganishia vaughanmartiniae]|uniref:Uncharacterized protein n=1 Tax=Naganishia vaughanmartiniae TaxID=1424756 RepID=A0ACC2XE73_9TREE|nr:hypothetical protein QFC22_001755 [Naganishia vaughanmartiniae]